MVMGSIYTPKHFDNLSLTLIFTVILSPPAGGRRICLRIKLRHHQFTSYLKRVSGYRVGGVKVLLF